MNAMGNAIIRSGLAAIASTTIGATALAGGDAPQLEVGWIVDGETDGGTLTGSGLGGGMYSYTAVTTGDSFEINWSFLVTDNGADGGFELLASTVGVTNTGDMDSIFGIDVLLPVDLGPGNAFYGGSLGGSLTGGDFGGYLSTVDDDTAMWAAMVDGNLLANLADAPFELTTAAFESADLAAESFGDPIPSLESTAARESMSIHLDFILGAGSTFAFTSNYVAQVPAPAGIALLGIAGLARRRRRD